MYELMLDVPNFGVDLRGEGKGAGAFYLGISPDQPWI